MQIDVEKARKGKVIVAAVTPGGQAAGRLGPAAGNGFTMVRRYTVHSLTTSFGALSSTKESQQTTVVRRVFKVCRKR